MSTDFQMNYHHNKDNLHVKMQGIFDGNSAHELLNLFLREYRCGGRVFVDTAGVSEVVPFGSKVLQARLCQTPVPASQLFFKGENGFNMAPSGSRVLIVPPLPAAPARRKADAAGNARTAHATANTGMSMGTEDAGVAANTITIINFFPSGAFS